MPERFLIEGQHKLEGIVEISGAKNSAGPILAATLLSKEAFVIDNLPLVEDVFKIIQTLQSLGSQVEWLGSHKIRIKAGERINHDNLALDLIGKTRASVLLIGPLVARLKSFVFSPPGGDQIGLRPITTHLQALEGLGAKITFKNNRYLFDASNLEPGTVVLPEFSVTATENLMMAVSRFEGKTRIVGAACEPHVTALGLMLVKMGVRIKGLASHVLEIEGSKDLKGVEYRVIPDHIEVGTFLTIGALTPGVLEIKNIVLEDLEVILAKMREIGVAFKTKRESLRVDFSANLKATKVQALPWPGFPTDLLPIIVPLLTQARGRSLIHDPLYENRLNFIHELRKMGGDIEIVDPHRAFVFGPTSLWGIEISSWDIRAGACLLAAALIAKGKTCLGNIYQIDRGYEKIEEKLQRLGAKIERLKN